MNQEYEIRIHQDEDGVFVAEVPTLPGCISQGRTRRRALANIKIAIEAYVESLKMHGDPIPPPIKQDGLNSQSGR